jgi:hypothetical protein
MPFVSQDERLRGRGTIHNEMARARHRQAAGSIFFFGSQMMIDFIVGAVREELEGGYTQAAMKTTGIMGSRSVLAWRSVLCYRLSGIFRQSCARQRRDAPQQAYLLPRRKALCEKPWRPVVVCIWCHGE